MAEQKAERWTLQQYLLPQQARVTIELPIGTTVVGVESTDQEHAYLLAETVDGENDRVRRTFLQVRHGASMEVPRSSLKLVGTFVGMNGMTRYALYEEHAA